MLGSDDYVRYERNEEMRQESRTIVARKRNKYGGGIIDLPYCGEEPYLSSMDANDNDATNSIFGSYYM